MIKNFLLKFNTTIIFAFLLIFSLVPQTAQMAAPASIFNGSGFGNNDPASGGSLTSGSSFGSNTNSPTRTNSVSCPKDFSDFPKVIDYITCSISSSVIPLLFAIALMVFVYGVINYVIAADGSENREEGRWFMIWGIVGLFVMVAVWGLVAVISNTIEIDTAFPPSF